MPIMLRITGGTSFSMINKVTFRGLYLRPLNGTTAAGLLLAH